jgi:hypothetical protein
MSRNSELRLCLTSSTNGGVPTPEACFNFGGGIIPALRGALGSGSTSIVREIDCESCNSCDVCGSGSGYTFDCSNIDEKMVQSECTDVTLLYSLQQTEKLRFLPNLD